MKPIPQCLLFLTWPLVAAVLATVAFLVLIALWFLALYGTCVQEKDAWRLLFPWK